MIRHTKLTRLLPVFVAIATITMIPITSSAFAQTDKTITDVAPDIQKLHDLKFEGKTNGWALVGNQAHAAHLALDGKAVHNENGVWIVKSNSELFLVERNANLELKGKVTDNPLRLNGLGN